jgi:hypothetical protein
MTSEPLRIVGTDRRRGHHLIVECSDGTTYTYLLEQLKELVPHQSVPTDSKLPEQGQQPRQSVG